MTTVRAGPNVEPVWKMAGRSVRRPRAPSRKKEAASQDELPRGQAQIVVWVEMRPEGYLIEGRNRVTPCQGPIPDALRPISSSCQQRKFFPVWSGRRIQSAEIAAHTSF